MRSLTAADEKAALAHAEAALAAADEKAALAHAEAALAPLPVSLHPDRGGARLSADGHALLGKLEYMGPDQAYLYFVFRTTSWDFAGERTDLHDTISLVVAALLSAMGETSMQCIDGVNPAVHGLGEEIYERYLVPRQPHAAFDLTRPDRLQRFVAAAFSAESMILQQLHREQDCPCETGSKESLLPAEPGWEWAALRALSRKEASKLFLSRRVWPEWQYLHVPGTALTLVHCPDLALLLGAADASQKRDAIQSTEGLFVRAGTLTHFIPHRINARALRVLKRLQDVADETELHLFPLEDRVIASGAQHVLSLPAASGREEYKAASVRAQARARRELGFLGRISRFRWSDRISPARFEDLVGELLRVSGAVSWIRQVGSTNERDRGRDFIADWVTSTSRNEIPQGLSPRVTVPVVVQCKAAKSAVGPSRVGGVVDIVEEHDAHGYFLAVASHLTSPLVDRLAALRQRRRFDVVDWWGRSELEHELRAAPEVAARFEDIVRVVAK